MLQSTEILQMSSAELLDDIKEMSVENPVVDYEEKMMTKNLISFATSWIIWMHRMSKTEPITQTKRVDESENDDWKFKENSHESLEEYLMEQGSHALS